MVNLEIGTKVKVKSVRENVTDDVKTYVGKTGEISTYGDSTDKSGETMYYIRFDDGSHQKKFYERELEILEHEIVAQYDCGCHIMLSPYGDVLQVLSTCGNCSEDCWYREDEDELECWDCGLFPNDGLYYCGASGSEPCEWDCPNNKLIGTSTNDPSE